MPVYPILAVQARISAIVTASVKLSVDGAIRGTDLDFKSAVTAAKGVIAPAVEKALRDSSFSRSCGGKTVRVVFNFELAGAADKISPQVVSFGYPNIFWISVPEMHWQP
jgi:hypothetical protein